MFSFVNGDKYEGEIKDDIRDGYGTATFLSGDIYIGEFKNN